MVTIQPLQVVLPSCLLGDISPSELDNGPSDNGVWKFGADLLKIIQRNYLYVPGVGIEEDVGAGYSRFGYSNFDFRRIQLSVMETFIFGKPQIANPVCIRRTTFFKSKVEIGRSDSVFRQDLFSRMAFFRQQLPEQFAAELSSDLLIGAEILFHDLSYENLSDVLKCLLTVTGDFCQVKMKESDEDRAKCSELKDFSLEEFSKFSSTVEEQCVSDFSVASKIGLRRLGEEQIRWLLEIRVFQLHAAFCFFFRKLENEDYEYAHLPLTIKVRLEKDDREAIVKAVKDQTVGPELLQSLKDLDQALHAPEAVIHMNRNPQETLRTYLEPFYDKGDFILSLFSGSVRLKHSVQVRMCIRGLIAELQKLVEKDYREPWIETATDVWDSFPELRNYISSDLAAANASLMGSSGFDETLTSSAKSISSNSKSTEKDSVSLGSKAEAITTLEKETTGKKEPACRREKREPIDLSCMTVDDVASFVTDAGFEELARMFTKDDVTGKICKKTQKPYQTSMI
ncbi:uncharacterized protein [Oscarella lobularis]|uniref:uncharacterized protein isoform X2 n=1 Tax=Oscarella lobularis TaxID=121494 RepID=UPI00331322CB